MSDNNSISWDDDDTDVEVDAPQQVSSPPIFPVTAGDETAGELSTFNPSSDIVSVETLATDGESEHLTVVQLDGNGNEITTTIDLALPPLDEGEAREITERIKSTTNILYVLIKRAHAGKAWKALGYNSFEAYVKDEFDYSRSYAYKLLNQADIIAAIEAVAPEGTEVYVGELTARGLKKSLPELLEKIEERTADADADEANGIIEDVIRETKERRDEEDNFDDDFDDDAFSPNDFASSSSAFDYIDDDDDSLDEFLGEGEDPSAVVHKLENLYTLLTGLQNFNDLASKDNLDDLMPIIPADRREEVTRLIASTSSFMSDLAVKWDAYLLENVDADDSDDEDDDDESDSDSEDAFN